MLGNRRSLIVTISALLVVSALASLQSMAAVTFRQEVLIRGFRIETDKASYPIGQQIKISIYFVNEGSKIEFLPSSYRFRLIGPGSFGSAGITTFNYLEVPQVPPGLEVKLDAMFWNQRDSMGNVAPRGVYILEIERGTHYGRITFLLS